MILRNLDRFGDDKLQAIQARAATLRDRVQADGGDAAKQSQEQLL